jgi:uncharacterized protein YlxW (UPF0749 family)
MTDDMTAEPDEPTPAADAPKDDVEPADHDPDDFTEVVPKADHDPHDSTEVVPTADHDPDDFTEVVPTADDDDVDLKAADVGLPIWRRALGGLKHPRLTGAGAVIALLVGLLGFALIAQAKSNDSSSTLSSDRPDDLVRILSDLDSRKDRLTTEITGLQATKAQLSSGAESKQAALAAASQRADELGILAGTLPAQGPGIVIEFRPTKSAIDADVILDAVEELRGAGAEAMEISGSNDQTVRIVAGTWFVDDNGGISVSGTSLTGTLSITVIGDPQTMQTALTIPGGVNDEVEQGGGTVLVQQPGTVRVTALAPANPLKYAHPVS